MTQKSIFNLPIQAGIYTEQTERGASGVWRDADKVRFRKGLPEKIGGWVQLQPQFKGTCRRLRDWTSLDGKSWTAIGTDKKLYVWSDRTLYDITPIRDSGQLTNPFDVSIGSSTVTVNHSNHGAEVGDFVRFEGATIYDGLLVDGEYEVASVIDENSYTIVDDTTAGSNQTGVGGTPSYEYDISIGQETVAAARGFGTGRFGTDRVNGWNTPAAQTVTLDTNIRIWSLDSWGEDLLACPRGGALYWWDKSRGTSVRAVALGGDAPIFNEGLIVSQRDRHVIAYGAYDYFNQAIDPLLIRWCSTEDLDDWIPTSTNTSGDLRLYSGSKIVGAVRSRLETLIFTDVSVHTLPFVGGFDVFGLNIVGENVSILGPNCAVPVDGRVFFMAEADFYIYDGIVRALPCDVRNYVYDNLNIVQKEKIYGGLNREFNEIWWFYPSFDPNCYVQQDFTLTLPPGYQLSQVSSGGTRGYTYQVSGGASGDFTQVVSTADNQYEHDFVLTNDEPILTPTQVEFAVELDVDSRIGAGTAKAGVCFLRTDVTGTIDTHGDDVNQMMVSLDKANNQVVVEKKIGSLGLAPAAPTNQGSNTVDFTTLTGSPMTNETKYIITVQFDTPQITVWVDGNQAFQFNLTDTEISQFTSNSAGLHQSPSATANQYRFYNFAIGPIGCLTASDFDISPIEVNRYVAFNYEEGTWSIGKMARTAWADRSPQLEKAYAAATDGYLYQHETGTDADGVAISAYIESFDMELPEAGESLMHVDQIIPDFLTLEGTCDVYLTGRKYPQDPNRISKGPYPVSNTTRKLSTRMRARQIALRVESSDTGDKWRFGTWRARAGAHGKRG